LQQPRQAVADRRGATVADVQRPGRIGRDEFHARGPAGTTGIAPVGFALAEDTAQFGMVGAGAEEEIDEARPGNFHFADLCTLRHCGEQRLGQRARVLARRLGQQKRGIRGEVAVVAIARAFDHERRSGIRRQKGLLLQARDGLQDDLAERFFHAGIPGLRSLL
jgi:hypothetical protein